MVELVNRLRNNEDGVSSLEMLFASMAMLGFTMFIFIIASAYWNNAIMSSTAQNAALTARFMTDSAIGKTAPSEVQTCSGGLAKTCTGSTGEIFYNPNYYVDTIGKKSTEHLLLVPKSGGACNYYHYASPTDNSSQVVNSSLATNDVAPAGASGLMDTTVTITAPFAPVPVPQVAYDSSDSFAYENCPTTATMSSSAAAQSFIQAFTP